MSAAIAARGVGVRFQFDRQQRVLTPTLARLRRVGRSAWALHDLDFAIEPGEGVALVGPSGSGKTTLLRLLAGVLPPDAGVLEVSGRIGALLATDAGLIGVLTGRENAELLGVLAGLGAGEARSALGRVQDLSGLGDAFDLPVSSYSQGMRARLGFATAAQREIDLLLLDEVHEALDHEFRAVVAERAEAIRAGGGIVVAAGHDHATLDTLCDRSVRLAGGAIVADGAFADVVDAYAPRA